MELTNSVYALIMIDKSSIILTKESILYSNSYISFNLSLIESIASITFLFAPYNFPSFTIYSTFSGYLISACI